MKDEARIALILYEDKMSGKSFPLHELILAMVCDVRADLDLHSLKKRVDKNPRNGIGNVIKDLGFANQIAGAGHLFVVIDSDRTAEQLNLNRTTPLDKVRDALLKRCKDATDRTCICFLEPNMEGLLRAINACAPHLPTPSSKNHNDRDIMLKKAAFSEPATARHCIRTKQPDLDALVCKLLDVLSNALPPA